MIKNKLSLIEYSILILYIILSSFNGIGLSNLISISNKNAYLSILISYIINIPLILLFIYILNYKQEMTLKEKIYYLYGKYLGIVIITLINISTIIMGIVLFNNIYLSVINTVLLNKASILFTILISIVIIYNNSKGINNIAKTSIIFFIDVIIIFLIGLVGSINRIDISNIFPILENGVTLPIKGAMYLSITIIMPIYILLNISKQQIDENSKINKYIILFYNLSYIIMFSITFLVISNLGILSTYYNYKEYNLYKKITLFNFLDRIENIIYISWIPTSIISISLIINFISNNKYDKNNFFMPSIILFIIILISKFLLLRPNIFKSFTINIYPYINVLLLIIMLITTINIFIRKFINNN